MGTKTTTHAAHDAVTKKPRVRHIDIVLDDEVADAYDDAVEHLTVLEKRLLESRPRRIAAARAALPFNADPETRAQVEAQASFEVVEGDEKSIQEARDEVERLRVEVEKHTRRYVFRALGRRAWEDLKAEHPPTPGDHEDVQQASGKKDARAEYNIDTLAPALICAASVSPRLTEDDVDEIFNGGDWNDVEIANMFQTALMAQVTARPNPTARKR